MALSDDRSIAITLAKSQATEISLGLAIRRL